MDLHTNTCQVCFLSHSHKRQTGLSALLVMLSESGFVGVSGRHGGIGDSMIAHIIDVGLYM